MYFVRYLPGHNGGMKYQELAQELSELMDGRLYNSQPVPVLTIDRPVRLKGKGVFDRYSDWERSHGAS